MIYHENKKAESWTWKDLNKKRVVVVYSEANPDVMEPETLGFYEMDSGTWYYIEDLKKVGG